MFFRNSTKTDILFGYIIIVFICVLFFFQSLDGHLYWHEVRFMYASTQFSVSELLAGYFNPHQIGGNIDEIGSGGFYLAKVLHIWLLKILFKRIDPAFGGLTIAIYVSLFMIIIVISLTYSLMKKLLEKDIDPLFAVLSIVLAPVTPYIAGKILSETTSLMFVTLSIWVFCLVFQREKSSFLLKSIICGIFLTIAGLCRLDMIITFFSFLFSAIIFCPVNMRREKIIKSSTVVILVFISLYLSVLYFLGANPYSLLIYLKNYYNLETKSVLMSIFGIISFGGLLYLLMVMSIFTEREKTFYFFATWTALPLCAMIFVTRNYMVEPRYLVSSLIPLCGLGAMGMQWAHTNIKLLKKKTVVLFIVGIFMIANISVIKLMPYELDYNSILEVTAKVREKNDNITILIPWSYTDFHFLRIMVKNANIYNVNTPSGDLGLVKSEWKERIRQWYGDAYIDSDSKLISLLKNGSCYYIGWRKYPPIEMLGRFASKIGLRKLENYLKSIPLKNHLAESWIWYSDKYHLEPAGVCGQYEYYKLLEKTEPKV